MNDYLTAAEVTARLGIKQQTLYAYVSRQLIRRITPATSKRSLYSREDVEKLAARRLKSAPQPHASADSLGETLPGISSAITQITPEGPIYRGHSFKALAAHPGRIENIAELLWTGVLLDEPITWENDEIAPNMEKAIAALQVGNKRVPILRVMGTASIVSGESASNELRTGSTARLARRLVCAYAGCLGMLTDSPRFVRPKAGESVAGIALRALGVASSQKKLTTINAVLIACADHELSSATYAARVVASTGAGLHACLLASIAGHSGHQLGGSCDRTEELFHAGQPGSGPTRQPTSFGEHSFGRLPGFNHPLYPGGDPRAAYLLSLAEELAGPAALSDIYATIAQAKTEAGQLPSLELGLVAVARALKLPGRSASALWAVGRSIGWVAHVMEQRLAGTVIRPRARFVSR